MESFQARSRDDIRLTYRAVGSSYGQAEFTQMSDGVYSAGLTDFGAGDIPMSQTNYDGLTSAGREMVHVPFCLGAIGIFHSVPSNEIGSGGLKLSPCVLAKIFSGQITAWDHAEILADNPGLTVPAGTSIQVGHRTTGSSSTGGTTGYLNAKCPSSWSLGEGSTVPWPSPSTFNSVEGSPGMTAHIAGTPYAIGYLDAGHGHQRGFGEVKLQNEAGTWLTSAEAIAAGGSMANNGVAAAGAAAVAAGDIPTSSTQSWYGVNLYRKGGTDTWPIVLVSYMYLKKDWSSMSPDKAGLLKAFVEYVVGTGQDMLPEFSFNPIPSAMNRWSEIWTNVIQKPAGGVTDFSFEESKEKWVGQGERVISIKRNSYSMWKINELNLKVEDTLTRLTALEGQPAPQIESEEADNTLAIVAIVIAIVALLMNCCGLLCIYKRLSKGDGFTDSSGAVIGKTNL